MYQRQISNYTNLNNIKQNDFDKPCCGFFFVPRSVRTVILTEINLNNRKYIFVINIRFFFYFLLQAGLELKENLSGGAPWPYGYPYPYDPSLAPYAFNG